jgi:hypothetical protein
VNAFADDRFVLFSGPLAATEHGRLRALLIIDADSEADIQPPRRRPVDAQPATRDQEHRTIESFRRR